MTNVKKIGTEFEREMCEYFRKHGWWVHFMSPDNTGAQPFDLIAVKGGTAVVGDCKTSAKPIFPISRLEDNQILAFEKWMSCRNSIPFVFIKYFDKVYAVSYLSLKVKQKIDLRAERGYDIETEEIWLGL